MKTLRAHAVMWVAGFVFLGGIASSAFASPVSLIDQRKYEGQFLSGSPFRLHSDWESGVAVELQYFHTRNDNETRRGRWENIRMEIPGLRYDSTAQQVVFEAPGNLPVVCATVREKSGVFGSTLIVSPTGRCQVTTSLGWSRRLGKTLDAYWNVY